MKDIGRLITKAMHTPMIIGANELTIMLKPFQTEEKFCMKTKKSTVRQVISRI
jgi:hypothetical protein